ncbi:MAG TPA: tetratricopeptide repeat protein [Candidatus Angelobacter sp.]|jgi:tetratricopeptide (TPR) repeat protein|nr:tetratricopeptide repeat protein [Candidatus Angelobacter sp.]
MTTSDLDIAEFLTANSPSVLIAEVANGPARRLWLVDRARDAAGPGSLSLILACDFDLGGAWAGVNQLFLELLPQIRTRRPDLLDRHAVELVYLLPELRRELTLRNLTLTDVASAEEKVRNYAADRALRNVHGLINLLDSWKTEMGADIPWVLVCDGYDLSGATSRYFFQELIRRRGKHLNLRFLIAVDPGNGRDVCASLSEWSAPKVVAVEVSREPWPALDPVVAAQKARQLEESAGDDRFRKQVCLPELIRFWRAAGRDDKVLHLKYFGLVVYLHLGQYADALRYADGLMALAEQHAPEDENLHRSIVIKILNGLMGNQASETELQAIEALALKFAEHAPPAWRVDIFYLLAMVHARFRKPRNFPKGEEYLERGLAALEQAGLPEAQYHFHYVFNRNGVAMIRSFQARHNEAIQICLDGIERLNKHVGADKHRLHRSVLVYNIAQVYFATGRYEEAIEHYTAAMAMDPNYSEYYNERGNIYLRMGQFEQARADYLRAIELSPPYYEVFTNLGQCYRNMENMSLAVEAYSRALDLQPRQALALAGRAQAQEALGNRDAAIADYSSALSYEPGQWEVVASRGVLYYEARDLHAALADFNRAIELKPDHIDLYQNRSVVFADLGRTEEAARDLKTALALNPPDEDKVALQEQLQNFLERVS